MPFHDKILPKEWVERCRWLGKHGLFVDLVVRSCVSMIIILKFECNIVGLRAHCLDLFKASPLVNSA
jgi:hypothetical protein